MKIQTLPYEHLLQALYCLSVFVVMIPNKGIMGSIVLVLLAFALIFSTASIVTKRALSYALWPMIVLLAALPTGIVLTSGGTSGAAAAIAMLLFGLTSLLAVYFIVLCLVFAPKDFYKLALIFVLSSSFVLGLDSVFITENEIGEKGSQYYLDSYPEWRVILSD